MSELELEAEAREWARTHTYGGYEWFPPKKPVGRGGKIRPVGMTMERALEIAMAVRS
jgi:hypothetical protein